MTTLTVVRGGEVAREVTVVRLEEWRRREEGANAMVERIEANTCWKRWTRGGGIVHIQISTVTTAILRGRCLDARLVAVSTATEWLAVGELDDGREWQLACYPFSPLGTLTLAPKKGGR